jgi:predicted RNase H-like HicB family nuclease
MSTAAVERTNVRYPSTETPQEAPLGYDVTVAAEVVEGVTVYVARHPALPRCFAQGDTPSEAESNLASVREAFIRDMKAADIDVAPPKLHPQTSYVSPESTPSGQHAFQWRVTSGDIEVVDF